MRSKSFYNYLQHDLPTGALLLIILRKEFTEPDIKRVCENIDKYYYPGQSISDVLLSPLRLHELETLIEHSVERVLKAHYTKPDEPTEKQDDFLTIQEAAEFLKLSVPTLYSKVSKQELPGVMKRGKRLYFSKVELIEYLKQGRSKTRSEIAEEAEAYLQRKKISK
jgi:excisionase family DNA binding protein